MDRVDALVAAARSGGDWAFARLWEELSGPVAGYLRARGVPDADDVTSEVFLAAFKGIRGFEGDGAQFRSWLFTIAHHRGVDSVRRRRRDVGNVAYLDEIDPRMVASAEDEALTWEPTDELALALAELTPDQRDVVLLRFVADLSLEEVAGITGRRVAAVSQLQRRGLDRLRRHLNGAIDGPAVISPLPRPIAEV